MSIEASGPIKLRVSNSDGDDYRQNMYTCSVGEAAKRFTAEEVDDGTALNWMQSVVAFINSGRHADER